MDITKTHPSIHLQELRKRAQVTVVRHGVIQSDYRRKLADVKAGIPSRVQTIEPIQSLQLGFGTSWLPGPLSYPWLLMVAGLPEVVRHLTGIV